MQQWEYKVVREQDLDEPKLTAYGDDGWDLVAMYQTHRRTINTRTAESVAAEMEGRSSPYVLTSPTWVFKRPKAS